MDGFDLNNVNGIYIGDQLASAAYLGNNLIWQSHDYSQDWFTIEAIDNCDITFTLNNADMELQYSIGHPKDNSWAGSIDSENNTISLQSGEITCLTGSYDTEIFRNSVCKINSTGRIKVYGNIMSLLDYAKSGEDPPMGDNEYADFRNLTDLSEYPQEIFSNLFRDCTNLIDASNLILPATTLVNYCYEEMFYGCTSLVKAPELPATTLTIGCYQYMFYGCTMLKKFNKLPATTLAENCYHAMFSGCTSLTKVPKILPATILTTDCYNKMFQGCTALTTAPTLPATTLAERCYYWMFDSCTNLNNIWCLATDISASNCTTAWLFKVASKGTFVKNASMTSWTTGTNGIPSGWIVGNAA